jgi:hypothetical protein
MKKFRIGLMIIASIMIMVQLIYIDFIDLSWSKNAGSYLGIVSMTLLIISMILSNIHDQKNQGK